MTTTTRQIPHFHFDISSILRSFLLISFLWTALWFLITCRPTSFVDQPANFSDPLERFLISSNFIEPSWIVDTTLRGGSRILAGPVSYNQTSVVQNSLPDHHLSTTGLLWQSQIFQVGQGDISLRGCSRILSGSVSPCSSDRETSRPFLGFGDRTFCGVGSQGILTGPIQTNVAFGLDTHSDCSSGLLTTAQGVFGPFATLGGTWSRAWIH